MSDIGSPVQVCCRRICMVHGVHDTCLTCALVLCVVSEVCDQAVGIPAEMESFGSHVTLATGGSSERRSI